MLVVIVIAPNADNTGPDLARIGTIEDLPDEVARPMLDLGTVRKPTEAELAAYRAKCDGEPHDEGDLTSEPAESRPGAFTPRFLVSGGQSQGEPPPDASAE